MRFSIYQLLWVLLLYLPAVVTAQPYSLRYLTVNDGLPSNETFAIHQKETGELVIGTEYGVVYYDGEDFKQIPFEESRYSGSIVLGIKSDRENRIWVKTYRDGFFYIENDTLRGFKGNELVTEKTNESTVDRFHIDIDMNIWFTIGNTADTIYKINSAGTRIDAINRVGYRQGINQFAYQVDANSFLIVKSRKNGPEQNSWTVTENNGDIAVIPPGEYWTMSQIRTGAFIHHPGGFWLSMGNTLLHWERESKKMQTFPFESEIYCLEEDRDGNILIGTQKGAFILLRKNGVIKPIFSNRIVHMIFLDNELGYWFATNNGVVYMPSLGIHLIDNKNFNGIHISAIAGSDSLVGAVGTDRYLRLFKTSNNEIVFVDKFYREKDITIPKKMVFNNNKFIYGTAYLDLTHMKEYHVAPVPAGEILDIEPGDKKGSLLFAFKRGYSVYNELPSKTRVPVYSPGTFCRAACQKNDRVYIGSDRGVYVSSPAEKLTGLYPEILKYSVNDIKSTSKEEIIVATRAGGVFVITSDSIYRLSVEEGLSSSLCSKIFIQNDTTFWIGTNKGLNRIYWHTGNYHIDNWYTEDGLISDKINDLARSGNFLVVLTDLGINYFEINNIGVTPPKLKIRLNEVRINGRLANSMVPLTLKPGEKDILFDFKVLGFKRRKNIQIVYVLRGKDQFLSQTGGRTIMYRDLSPGEYTLEVLVLGSNGEAIGSPLNYRISIEPYFYETTFFKVSVIVLMAALVLGGVLLYFKRLEAGRRRKWEYSNAQLEALNMQINPHFLFNSLNNIQYLSFSKEHKVLNRFISGLSELLRGILKNSKTNLIPLADELSNIKHYLELEVMRFEDETFSYKIIVDETLALDKERIPPMLVQPLVENAVWHGLLTKKGDKYLEVYWTKTPSGFQVEVVDNGIGIDKSVAGKKPGNSLRHSLGLENVKRRLELYESMGYGKASLLIEDLTGKKPYFEGTRATMMFDYTSVKNKGNAVKIGNSG